MDLLWNKYLLISIVNGNLHGPIGRVVFAYRFTDIDRCSHINQPLLTDIYRSILCGIIGSIICNISLRGLFVNLDDEVLIQAI